MQGKQKAADKSDERPKNKYSLHDPIDLRSKFLLGVEAEKLQKAFKQKQKELQEHLEQLKILEKLPDDEHHGNRRHAWIVILSNVDWAAKKCAGPDHRCDENSPIQPFFIEPSTGTHFATNDPNYFAIESVWNENNYYVSLSPTTLFTMCLESPLNAFFIGSHIKKGNKLPMNGKIKLIDHENAHSHKHFR